MYASHLRCKQFLCRSMESWCILHQSSHHLQNEKRQLQREEENNGNCMANSQSDATSPLNNLNHQTHNKIHHKHKNLSRSMLQRYTTTLEVCAADQKRGFQYTDWYKTFPTHKSSTDMTNQQQAFKAAKNPTNEKHDNLHQTSVQCFCSVILLTISKPLHDPEFDTTQHHWPCPVVPWWESPCSLVSVNHLYSKPWNVPAKPKTECLP